MRTLDWVYPFCIPIYQNHYYDYFVRKLTIFRVWKSTYTPVYRWEMAGSWGNAEVWHNWNVTIAQSKHAAVHIYIYLCLHGCTCSLCLRLWLGRFMALRRASHSSADGCEGFLFFSIGSDASEGWLYACLCFFLLALQVYLEVYWWIKYSHFKCIDMVICFVVRMEWTRRKTSSRTIVEAQREEHKVLLRVGIEYKWYCQSSKTWVHVQLFWAPSPPTQIAPKILNSIIWMSVIPECYCLCACFLYWYVNKFFHYCYTSPLHKKYF